MSKKKLSMIFNGVLFFLVLLSFVLLFAGINFMGHDSPFLSVSLSVFKYFTIDSNCLLGISALILFMQKLRKNPIKKWQIVLKFAATTSVFLTFMVTACFLAPFSNYHFTDFYLNSNLFFHFLIPVLSIISFVFFDLEQIPFIYTFYGIIPMILYAIGYIIHVIPHVQGNRISLEYDFYGFFRAGVSSVYYVVPIILFGTYVLGFGLWFMKERFQKHKKR